MRKNKAVSHLKAAKEKKEKKNVLIRMPYAIYEDLMQEAEDHELSQNQFCCLAIDFYINNLRRKGK